MKDFSKDEWGLVWAGGGGKGTQALHLASFAGGVGGRKVQARLDVANTLSTAETFGENVHEGGVDVVDRCARLRQLGGNTTYCAVC